MQSKYLHFTATNQLLNQLKITKFKYAVHFMWFWNWLNSLFVFFVLFATSSQETTERKTKKKPNKSKNENFIYFIRLHAKNEERYKVHKKNKIKGESTKVHPSLGKI